MRLTLKPHSSPILLSSSSSRQGLHTQYSTPTRSISFTIANPKHRRSPKAANVSEGFEVEVPETSTVPKVLIAGGGIGGLVSALGLLKSGYDVQIFERDLTAIRGEGKYRGPIQIQSNALAALEAIDKEMAEEVFAKGVVTGDRVNGLCDGFTGEWYVKFDTFSPAAKVGLPVTRVINRVTLQEILCRHVKKWSSRGDGAILEGCHVIGYEEKEELKGKSYVSVLLEDGRKFNGDLLIGADGIWSKVRTQLFGASPPNYSEYTCYTGISDFIPHDIDTVGYRVFLGNGKYFVSSDVGAGKMQWYGFNKEPQGGSDPEGERKKRLLEIFGTWCDDVVDLIEATTEEDVLRRDIFDKPPIFQWHKGRVIVLGDAAHAMQPNLGQGGCMAIEDAFQLCLELGDVFVSCKGQYHEIDYSSSLKKIAQQRVWRAAIIHWLAAMAAISATTYKTYMGEGLGFLSFITRYRIPHFGKVAGQIILRIFMPFVLGWVLGGNMNTLKKGSYIPCCRLEDRPNAFELSELKDFIDDDKKLKQASLADWWILPFHQQDFINGVEINSNTISIGSDEGSDIRLSEAEVDSVHAKICRKIVSTAPLRYQYLMKSTSRGTTIVNEDEIAPNKEVELAPGDILQFGQSRDENKIFKIKLRHVSCRATEPPNLNKKDLVEV